MEVLLIMMNPLIMHINGLCSPREHPVRLEYSQLHKGSILAVALKIITPNSCKAQDQIVLVWVSVAV